MDHVRIFKSPCKGKAYRAVFTRKDNQTATIDFGSSAYENYTQHHDEQRKKNYLSRFRKLIDRYKENPQAPTTLSTWILWSQPSILDAFNNYLKHFKLQGKIYLKGSKRNNK